MTMKNMAMKVISVMLVLAVMTPFTAGSAFASTTVEINGEDEVNVGNEFTVQIEFSGDNMLKVDGQLGYDPAKLEYVSGAEDGGEGYVILKKGGGDGSVDFDVTFKAIKGGNTGLDVSSGRIIDNNKNEVENCAVTKVIHISGDVVNDDENVVDEEEPLPQEAEYADNQRTRQWIMLLAGGVLCALVFVIVFLIYRARNKRKEKKSGKKQAEKDKKERG